MRTLTRLGVASGLGAAAGLLWILAYTPVSHAVLPVLVAHVGVAVALERTLWLARLRSPLALALGIGVGLLVVPAWLRPLVDAGVLGGKVGAALMGLGVFAGGLLAGGLGALLTRGRAAAAGGLLGLAGLGLAMVGSAAVVTAEARPETQPQAAAVSSDFPPRKVAIIGIDGADWSVIGPLVAEGRLPALAGLVARGREGVLKSIVPTYSPVVWNTIFSGQPPEVHGLVDWYSSDARSRRVPLLWDIFGAHGRSSLTVNVPGTWPPAEVERGVMLSGFPIPGLTTGDKGQLLGQVASTEAEEGPVPTERVRAQGDGRFVLDVPLAAPDLKPRFGGLRNALMDTFVRKQLLALRGHRLKLQATLDQGPKGPFVRLEGPALREAAEVRVADWSSWLRVRDGALEAVLRAHVLEADEDTLRLYLTPAYQAPWAPRFAFATGVDPSELQRGEPYVVEGLGWKASHDPRVADLVPAALTDIEEGHVATAERLLRDEPDLFSFVITITDRVQHPFWPLHQPEDYAGRLTVPPGMERDRPVEDAYITADLALGRLLRRLPEDALVFVVSDHGFTSTDEEVEGEHRLDGVWIAAGPMIPPSDTPQELQVTDVVPTVLRCLGVPVAEDFAGQAIAELCPEVPAAPPVATYRRAQDVGEVHTARIDRSREAQLEAMGYLESEDDQEDRE